MSCPRADSDVFYRQVLDNAVISAGIMDEARDMLPRLSQLMQAALRPGSPPAGDAAPAASPGAAAAADEGSAPKAS